MTRTRIARLLLGLGSACLLSLSAACAPAAMAEEVAAADSDLSAEAGHDVQVLSRFAARGREDVPVSRDVRTWTVRDVRSADFDGDLMLAYGDSGDVLFALAFDRRTSRAIVFQDAKASAAIDEPTIEWVRTEMARMGDGILMAGDVRDGKTNIASLRPLQLLGDGAECALRVAGATLLVAATWKFSLAVGFAVGAAAALGWGVYDVASDVDASGDFATAGFDAAAAGVVKGAAKAIEGRSIETAAKATGVAGLVVVGAVGVYAAATDEAGIVDTLLPDACRRAGLNDALNEAFGWN